MVRRPQPQVRAWRPAVAGIAEVYHAHLTGHAYPLHTHGAWTLLIVDDGMVRYDLDRHEHGALRTGVTLLPPHVPHNGSPITPDGFRKRVLYLDPEAAGLGEEYIGLAVDAPVLADAALRDRIHRLHDALVLPGEELESESRLAFIAERLRRHLERRGGPAAPAAAPGLAHALRDLLDARLAEGLTLREASGLLHAHPAHLVRAFSREFAISPHQYLTARRVDAARRLLLDGMAPRDAAVAAGFHDQPHLTRHFKRVLGVPPGRFTGRCPAPAPSR
ncbi:AraC family transcriptional regulator [Streptomyces sp. Ru73]|uniref:helix-turn-helix transcriptional regulator n=1 Tax=Streptomyces sp. Ru73 TaxID=2080748 RepID=UPI000CDDFAFC|nr:AraC family transcriptional regulator [Streptomyces sp. Ru73]POX41108.1 AraC family transcriptional regulator [Streptomyces sp. Ru73]